MTSSNEDHDLTGWATRPELAEHADVSHQTLSRLWADRETNGHPPAQRIGGRLRWRLDQWDPWWAQYQEREREQRQQRGRHLVPAADRSGDPDELIGPAEVARVLGYKDTSTVSHNVKHRPEGWPEPDDEEQLPSGRTRPKWRRRVIWAYADQRGHRAAGGRRPGSRNNPPYAYYGDPRLTLARRLLAKNPGISTGDLVDQLAKTSKTAASGATWRRIISTARQHPEGERS